jgi:mevalonate kinase
MSTKRFYAHGKLMLTGEYAVLDGAKSLAIPTKFGQSLVVSELLDTSHQIEWRGYNSKNELWLSANLPDNVSKKEEVLRLQNILKALEELNPNLFYQNNFAAETVLEFPNNWGLGSSSTLISLLAQWGEVDPFDMLQRTFGGSAYDIACATANGPICYQLLNGKAKWHELALAREWTDHAYFVFLEQKQNSRDGIKHYRGLKNTEGLIEKINKITDALGQVKDVTKAINLFEEHESIMSEVLKLPSINEARFNDFAGVCKSLGAWGGDFFMAVSNTNKNYITEYFAKKGLKTIFAYKDMIWSQ